MDSDYVEIYRPRDPQEATLIRIVLEGAGIPFFITNENFSSIMPMADVGGMRLMVDRGDVAAVIEFLREGLGLDLPAPRPPEPT